MPTLYPSRPYVQICFGNFGVTSHNYTQFFASPEKFSKTELRGFLLKVSIYIHTPTYDQLLSFTQNHFLQSVPSVTIHSPSPYLPLKCPLFHTCNLLSYSETTLKPGTDLCGGKSMRTEAATARCTVQIKLIFASHSETNHTPINMRNVCMMRAIYTLECLPRLSTLQIEPDTCPHCACTKLCFVLMDQQPMDRAAHRAEADHAVPHYLHASLFPALEVIPSTILLQLVQDANPYTQAILCTFPLPLIMKPTTLIVTKFVPVYYENTYINTILVKFSWNSQQNESKISRKYY